jgi:hypothetical protein
VTRDRRPETRHQRPGTKNQGSGGRDDDEVECAMTEGNRKSNAISGLLRRGGLVSGGLGLGYRSWGAAGAEVFDKFSGLEGLSAGFILGFLALELDLLAGF